MSSDTGSVPEPKMLNKTERHMFCFCHDLCQGTSTENRRRQNALNTTRGMQKTPDQTNEKILKCYLQFVQVTDKQNYR